MIDWVLTVFAAAGRVMTFSGGREQLPPLAVAWGIAFFAGASTLLGHSAVFYINRIKGRREAAALALSGVLLALLYTIHGAVLYLLTPFITGSRLSFTTVVAIALASTAPMILGIFEFIPAFGLVFGKILNAWSFAALWLLILHAYQTTPVRALLAGGAAWLVMQFFSKFTAAPIAHLVSRLWRAITGVPTLMTARDILSGTPMIPVSAPMAVATEDGGH